MTDTLRAEGYAVIENDEILVDTVSPTHRAAVVNFLVVHRRIGISNHMTDDTIYTLWEAHRGSAGRGVAIVVPEPI